MTNTLAPRQDWNQYADWPSDHQVKVAFGKHRRETRELKAEGIGVFRRKLRNEDVEFLRENMRRLNSETATEWQQVLRKLWKASPERLEEGYRAFCVECSAVMKLDHGPAKIGDLDSREYLILQSQLMEPRAWPDPAVAMLYAATQAATHRAVSRWQRKVEPEASGNLVDDLLKYMEAYASAMKAEGVGLPQNCFLNFGCASMQGGTDRLGSDFAIVVGAPVMGRPMYRVAIFQAKWEDTRGHADVSEGEGRQLAQLLASGMGHYAFYPKVFDEEEGTFLLTVRPVEDVCRDVWADPAKPKYRVDVSQGGEDVAWDFPLFIVRKMTSPDNLHCGRLFPDAASVAAALSQGRMKPLAPPPTFVANFTGALEVAELIERLRKEGLDKCAVSELPSASDMLKHGFGEDAEGTKPGL